LKKNLCQIDTRCNIWYIVQYDFTKATDHLRAPLQV
jgi:hypothetical protein